MTGTVGRIDKSYYVADLAAYYRDYLIPLAVFVASFVWCIDADWPLVVVPLVIASFAVHRAGAFVHEITHRYKDPRMKSFIRLWNLTIGAVIQLPAPRFFKPHLVHHARGTFGTKADPQYLELRHDPKFMIFVLFVGPFLMPLLNFALMVTASLGVDAEAALERFLQRHFDFTMGSEVEQRHRREVTNLSRYYLAVFAVYAALLPQTVPLLYLILVGGWLLVTLRIPLEHRMERHVDSSDRHDQLVDSFTVEAPLAALLQPLGLRFHTAHHLYPGVPYHRLRQLHYELKARGDAEYNRNVLTFWQAVRGPGRAVAAQARAGRA